MQELKNQQTPTQTKCEEPDCQNQVEFITDSEKKHGCSQKESKFMSYTTSGYRCCSSSNSTHFLCSQKCLDQFNQTQRCHQCYEYGQNCRFVKKLGHSLCFSRNDGNIPCLINYKLINKIQKCYRGLKLSDAFRIVTDLEYAVLPTEFQDNVDLRQLINKNGNLITFPIIYLIAYSCDKHKIPEQSDNIMLSSCFHCQKNIQDMNNIYYIYNYGQPLITCCHVTKENEYGIEYHYQPDDGVKKKSHGGFILELSIYVTQDSDQIDSDHDI